MPRSLERTNMLKNFINCSELSFLAHEFGRSDENVLQKPVIRNLIFIDVGIEVNRKNFKFEIFAFCCDMPARSFIKCCKSHTGFFSCERCTVKGETINYTRVFKEISCEERTLQTFRDKTNLQHHSIKEDSPLLDIINFDPVKFVVLDEMHMLYLGISKYLLQKLILKSSDSFISEENVLILQKHFKNISKDVPTEFQRKKFDLLDLSNWKATQFRFFFVVCWWHYFKKCFGN